MELQRKKIGADGSIIAVPYEETQKDRGFRPGMPRLRDIKSILTPRRALPIYQVTSLVVLHNL